MRFTPATRDGRPVYKVTGSITLPPDGGVEKCRMQLVARDGIEPPTPAFFRAADQLRVWNRCKPMAESHLPERPSRIFWDQLGYFRLGDVPVLFPACRPDLVMVL